MIETKTTHEAVIHARENLGVHTSNDRDHLEDLVWLRRYLPEYNNNWETFKKDLEDRFHRKGDYKKIINEHAREGWRLVQIFSPGTGPYGSASYFEIIFEKSE